MEHTLTTRAVAPTLEKLAAYYLIAALFVLPMSITLTDVGTVGAAILLLAAGNWKARCQRILHNPVAVCFLIYFAMHLIALTYTHATWQVAFKDIYKHHWILFTPLLLTAFNEDKHRDWALLSFLSVMMLILVLSYLRAFGINLIHSHVGGVGVFEAHITQNYLLTIAGAILAYQALHAKRHRWVYASLFLLTTINVLFLSTGRTGYIVFSVLLLYIFTHKFGWKGLLLAALSITLLFGAAYLVSPTVKKTVQTTLINQRQFHHGNTHTSIGLRMAMFKNAITLIKQKPWIGYGTGGISAAYRTLPKAAVDATAVSYWPRYPDSTEFGYLNIMLTFGLLGFVVFLVLMWVQWKTTFTLKPKYKFIMQVFLLTYFIAALANPFFYAFRLVHLYALFTAVLFSAYHKKK